MARIFSNLSRHERIQRYLFMYRVISLPVSLFVFLMVFSGNVHVSGGAVGGSGGSSGTTTGTYSRGKGYGWVLYKFDKGGPSGGFKNGIAWSGVINACRNTEENIDSAFVHVLSDEYYYQSNPKNLKSFDYDARNVWGIDLSLYSRLYNYWNNDQWRAERAYSQGEATWAFYYGLAEGYFVTGGLTWGTNIGWFCWSTNPVTNSGTITPVSTANPDKIEPTETATFTHSIIPGQANQGTTTGNWQITRTENGATTATTSGSFSVGNAVIAVGGSRTYIAGAGDVGRLICEYLTLSNTSSGVTVNNPNPSATACVRVIARPIVKFSGLDVDFCTNPNNLTNPVGGVHTWAKLKDGAYVGSSSQYALFVYDAISGDGADKRGFFTGAATTVADPKKLTFANTVGGIFGGDWGDTTPCTNYFEEEYGTSGEKLPNPLPIDGSIVNHSSASSIAEATPVGTNRTVYVNGDATITGNITYTSVGWTLGNIPSYRLIVNGNIYINPGVAQLDGFYFATGNIYTCSTDSSYSPSNASYYTDCDNPLVVNGAFESLGSIKYWRTANTLATSDTTAAAETFNFSPEMFLTTQWIDNGSSSSGNPIQSIKSLPPVF
jgi:hypothetical protein